MPQSMLAFLAMAMAVMLAVTQMRSDLRSHQSMVSEEFEIMANAVTLEQLDIISVSTSWDSLDVVWDDSIVVRGFGFNGDEVDFDLAIAVQYVDAGGNPAAGATTRKEVAVSAGNDRFILPLVTHARIFSE